MLSVDMQVQLGGQATCSIELTDAQAAAEAEVQPLETMLARFGSRSGRWQTYLDSRDLGGGPDFTVEIDVGSGQLLKFEGWVAQAQAGAGLSGANHTIQAVGVDQIIEAIDPSVYDPVLPYRQDFFKAEEEGFLSLGQALGKALEEWRSRTAEAGKILPEFSVQAIKESVRVNDVAMTWLSQLFARTTNPFLDSVLATSSTVIWPGPREFLTFFFNLMSTQGGSSMVQAIRSLASAFGSQYVPSLEGVGRLVDNKTLLTQEANQREVEAQDLYSSSSRQAMTQVNRVTAEAQVVEVHRGAGSDGGDKKQVTSKVLGAFPRASEGQGVTQPIPPPPWTGIPSGLPPLELEEGFDLEKLKPAVEDSEEQTLALQERARQVMDWWAEQAYLWLRLLESRGSLPNLPLDPSYVVGERLSLTANDGQPIGVGLITGVSHMLSLHENQMQARTSVNLSHMDYTDDA